MIQYVDIRVDTSVYKGSRSDSDVVIVNRTILHFYMLCFFRETLSATLPGHRVPSLFLSTGESI